jgi:hypothetical protein
MKNRIYIEGAWEHDLKESNVIYGKAKQQKIAKYYVMMFTVSLSFCRII